MKVILIILFCLIGSSVTISHVFTPIEVRKAIPVYRVDRFKQSPPIKDSQKYTKTIKQKPKYLIPKIEYSGKDYDIIISTECNWLKYEGASTPIGISVKIVF